MYQSEVRMYEGPMGRARREAREKRGRIVRGVALAVLLVGAFIGAGILETQRIQVMEATSAEATMAAMGIYQ